MILVVEPVCQGVEHAAFNGAMLLCAQQLAGSDSIEFHAEPAHLQAVGEMLEGRALERVSMHGLSGAQRHLGELGERIGKDLSVIWSVLRKPRIEPLQLVIITCVTEDTLLAAKLLFGLWFRRVPVLVVLHGVLPSLLYSRKRRLLLGLATPPHMRALVLGRHIKRNLQQSYPWLARCVDAIRHPYVFQTPTPQPVRAGPPRFGFIGLANLPKGFDTFLATIETLGARHPGRLAGCFHLIGRVDPSFQSRFDAFRLGPHGQLLDLSAGSRLALKDFQAAVSGMDYLVMPYGAGMYDMVFSGSSLDAFAYLRPVIALRSSFFEELFAAVGDIGYLCETQQAMTDCIESLIFSAESEGRDRQRQNLLRGRSLFTPEAVAEELQALLLQLQSPVSLRP